PAHAGRLAHARRRLAGALLGSRRATPRGTSRGAAAYHTRSDDGWRVTAIGDLGPRRAGKRQPSPFRAPVASGARHAPVALRRDAEDGRRPEHEHVAGERAAPYEAARDAIV